jgi:hypothetical protein
VSCAHKYLGLYPGPLLPQVAVSDKHESAPSKALFILNLVVSIVSDADFASCERPCNELDWPMICRIKLTLEVYQTFSR